MTPADLSAEALGQIVQSAQRQLLGDVAGAARAGSAGWADGPNGNREQFRVGLATAAADADGWASVNYSVQRLVKADDGTVGTTYAAVAQGSVRLPASAAGNFATVVDREVNNLNADDRVAAARRTEAWLEAATKAVPFGTLAVDLNDGKAGWATAGATLVDAAGLLTGAFAARGAGALRGATAAARAEARAAAVARLERWHAAVARKAEIVADFAEEGGELGGRLYSIDRLRKLQKYLGKRGVTLEVDSPILPFGKRGAFLAHEDGTAHLLLQTRPMNQLIWHELSHFIQWKKIGPEAYRALPRKVPYNAPEQFVFDMLEHPNRWYRLSPEYRIHAAEYVERVGGFR